MMDTHLVQALYRLAADYQSGQWSRGYRLLCRLQRYARRHGITLPDHIADTPLYQNLVERYAEKL